MSDQTSRSAPESREVLVVCPWCGREVTACRDSTLTWLMFGHRVTMPHTPETPWCAGGGREIPSSDGRGAGSQPESASITSAPTGPVNGPSLPPTASPESDPCIYPRCIVANECLGPCDAVTTAEQHHFLQWSQDFTRCSVCLRTYVDGDHEKCGYCEINQAALMAASVRAAFSTDSPAAPPVPEEQP